MPILEVDGKHTFVESKAIYRYLAREFGFYGCNNMEATQIDVITEVVGDMWAKLTKAFFMKDEAAKVSVFHAHSYQDSNFDLSIQRNIYLRILHFNPSKLIK